MGKTELNATVNAVRKLRVEIDKLQASLDSLTALLKAEMDSTGVDTLMGTDWKITYKLITSTRIDTTALKRELPDIASRYSKIISSKRFTIS